MIGLKGFASKAAFKRAIAEGNVPGKVFYMKQDRNYEETSLHGEELLPNKWVPFVEPNAYTDRRFYGNLKVDEAYRVLGVK